MQPIEILFSRFVLGYLALWLVARRALRVPLWQEKYFALAGFFGIFLYYLLENVALSYTFASNVGVMVVVAPLFTAILSRLFGQDTKRLGAGFFAGFVLAMAGIALISFNGTRFELSPKGDILAVLAALSWAFYSLLVRKIGEFGHPSIEATRRTFFYGLLFMLPALWFFDASPLPAGLANPICLANVAFLGLGASAMCFVSWNFSIRVLGHSCARHIADFGLHLPRSRGDSAHLPCPFGRAPHTHDLCWHRPDPDRPCALEPRHPARGLQVQQEEKGLREMSVLPGGSSCKREYPLRGDLYKCKKCFF